MTPLPLLNLPLIAIEDTLRYFNPIELFNISLCSKQAQFLVKSSRLHLDKICKINVDVSETLEFRVGHSTEEKYDCWSFTVACVGGRKTIFRTEELFFSEDTVPGLFENLKSTVERFKIILTYVQDLFHIPEIDDFSHCQFPINFVTILDWILARQQAINFAEIFLEPERLGPRLKDSDISDALDRLHHIKEFEFVMEPSKDFVQNDTRLYVFNIVYISRGQWITFPRLLNMSFVHLIAHDTQVTARQMNVFLKRWMRGGNWDMRELELEGNAQGMRTAMEVFEDVEYKVNDPDVLRIWTDAKGREDEVAGGVDIQRNDGTSAMVHLSVYGYPAKIRLQMFVFN